jgi:transposase
LPGLSLKLNTLKKKTFGYSERCEKKRLEFQEAVAKLDPNTLHYLDEAGINNDEVYPYGWAKKGDRLLCMKQGKKTKRISFISSLFQGKFEASLIFEGPCNRSIFEMFLEKLFLPKLTPGDTVILDNATFHHGGRIKQLIEQAGCNILYLPPYSPDLNKIEHYWFFIKNAIRHVLVDASANLYDVLCYQFQRFSI